MLNKSMELNFSISYADWLTRMGMALLLFLFVFGTSLTVNAQDETPEDVRAKQAYALGVTAYVWGYPMVVM